MILFKEINLLKKPNFQVTIKYYNSEQTFDLSPEIFSKSEKEILFYLLNRYVFIDGNSWKHLVEILGESAKELYTHCDKVSKIFVKSEVEYYKRLSGK